jgi:hypothetical protein
MAGIDPLPTHVKGGAAKKVIHSLLAAGLITKKPFTITPAGRNAIDAAPEHSKPSVPAALERSAVSASTSRAAPSLSSQPPCSHSSRPWQKSSIPSASGHVFDWLPPSQGAYSTARSPLRTPAPPVTVTSSI